MALSAQPCIRLQRPFCGRRVWLEYGNAAYIHRMKDATSRRQAIATLLTLSASTPALACEQPLELLRVFQPGAGAGKPSMAAILRDHIEAQAQALGCSPSSVDVPRARQLQLFMRQQTDFLYPANRNAQRDAVGQFVPLYRARPMLLSRRPLPAAVRDVPSLLASKLRVASVRGVEYSGAAKLLQTQLLAKRRWISEAEVPGLLRALREGVADAALVSPLLLIGIPELKTKWKWTALPELEWREVGVYLSLRIAQPLRSQLQEMLLQSHKALRERMRRDADASLLSADYIEFL